VPAGIPRSTPHDDERGERIIQVLTMEQQVRTAELAQRFGVSEMTIRRDLASLEAQQRLRRIHGGAIAPGSRAAAPPLSIGMVVPSAEYYFPKILQGAREACASRGARLVSASSDRSASEQLRQIADLIDRGVDGLIVTPVTHVPRDSSTFAALRDSPVPVTLIERVIEDGDDHKNLDIVRSEHAQGAAIALAHLVDMGHRSVALMHRNSPTASRLRQGYLRGLDRHGLAEHTYIASLSVELSPQEAHERIRAIADELLNRGFTAAIVLPDADAILLQAVLGERGIDVPRRFSIIAYDDESAAYARMPLTSIAPAKAEIGRLAANGCLDRIIAQRRGVTLPIKHTTVLPLLQIRKSTGRRTSSEGALRPDGS